MTTASTRPAWKRLLSAARSLGDPVVVAPAGPQSGVSHAVTWHEGVRLEPRGEDRFAIHGTPADCTRLGLLHVVPDAKWILSGINHGANLGADVYYSGTVAAVREARPARLARHRCLALPQERASRSIGNAPHAGSRRSRATCRGPIEPGLFYNVNLPLLPPGAADPEVVWCPLDPKPLPLNYRHEEESGTLLRGRLQPAPAHPRSGCGRLLRRPNRRHRRSVALIRVRWSMKNSPWTITQT